MSKPELADAYRLLLAVETSKRYHKSWGGEEDFLCVAAIEAEIRKELLGGFPIPTSEVLAEYFYYLIDTYFSEVAQCRAVVRGLGIAHLPDKQKFKILKEWWEAHLNVETATAFLEQANFN